jgi:hypothetical protein
MDLFHFADGFEDQAFTIGTDENMHILGYSVPRSSVPRKDLIWPNKLLEHAPQYRRIFVQHA